MKIVETSEFERWNVDFNIQMTPVQIF